MANKESFLSPTAVFLLFTMSMCPCISLEKEGCWIWILRKISIKCHNNPNLVPPHKQSDPMMDIYCSQNFDLKARVYTWKRMRIWCPTRRTTYQIHTIITSAQKSDTVIPESYGYWLRARPYRDWSN